MVIILWWPYCRCAPLLSGNLLFVACLFGVWFLSDRPPSLRVMRLVAWYARTWWRTPILGHASTHRQGRKAARVALPEQSPCGTREVVQARWPVARSSTKRQETAAGSGHIRTARGERAAAVGNRNARRTGDVISRGGELTDRRGSGHGGTWCFGAAGPRPARALSSRQPGRIQRRRPPQRGSRGPALCQFHG